jgi:hypothetical protein
VSGSGKFCPECGRPLEADATTAIAVREEPRRQLWPPGSSLLLVLAPVLAAAAAVGLLTVGLWVWGLLALLLAVVLLLVPLGVLRRGAERLPGRLGARLSVHRDVLAARSRGQLELFRARRELAELEAQRARGYQDLGRTVFEQDEAGSEQARDRLDELARHIRAKEAEIRALAEEISNQVRRAQAGEQPAKPTEPEASKGHKST